MREGWRGGAVTCTRGAEGRERDAKGGEDLCDIIIIMCIRVVMEGGREKQRDDELRDP